MLQITLSDMKRFTISLEPICIPAFGAVGVPSAPQAGVQYISAQDDFAISAYCTKQQERCLATGVLPQANNSLSSVPFFHITCMQVKGTKFFYPKLLSILNNYVHFAASLPTVLF